MGKDVLRFPAIFSSGVGGGAYWIVGLIETWAEPFGSSFTDGITKKLRRAQ